MKTSGERSFSTAAGILKTCSLCTFVSDVFCARVQYCYTGSDTDFDQLSTFQSERKHQMGRLKLGVLSGMYEIEIVF